MEIRSESVQIQTRDGAMTTHVARPQGSGPHPGVVVVMEAFGLNGHIKKVADRVAAEGYVVAAPDLYHRATDATAEYSDLPKALKLMGQLDDDKIAGDLGSAVEWLRTQPGVRADRIGMTGFCMGGYATFLAATRLPLQAAAPFYGGGIARLLGAADKISAPMVLFFGDQDGFIPMSEVEQIESRLSALGKEAEVVVYPGAEHGFFCDERPSYQQAAATDAWRRLTKLFQEKLAK